MIKNLETAKTSGLFRFNTLIFIRLSRNCLYYYLKSKGIKFVSVLQLGQNHLLEDKQFSRYVKPNPSWTSNAPHTFSSNIPYFFTKGTPTWEIWTKEVLKYLNLLCQIRQKTSIWNLEIYTLEIKSINLPQDATIDYILSTKRFDEPLLWIKYVIIKYVLISNSLRSNENNLMQFFNICGRMKSFSVVSWSRISMYGFSQNTIHFKTVK